MIIPSPNGFTKGIHKWAVQFAKDTQFGTYSRRAIVVVTKAKDEWINKNKTYRWVDDDSSCHWNGGQSPNETIQIILNLNSYTIEFYRIHPLEIECKEQKLNSTETCYFALAIDYDERCAVFECVYLNLIITHKFFNLLLPVLRLLTTFEFLFLLNVQIPK